MTSSDASGVTVRLENLSRAYGDFIAIDRLDLTIACGEFFTLLGPSGSGKTTILMMIAGFTEPTSGEIYFADRALSRVPPHQRNVGVVFQNYSLFPHMNVAENIAFPLRLRGMDTVAISDRVNAMLELVQLTPFIKHMPQKLSGGQQQRVALARALVFKPSVLLLDEPLSALDKGLRAQMQIELRELHRKLGMTVICVTHDQSEALALSDQIAVLNHGKLEQVGTPEGLYERPDSRFVASFIGESNAIHAQYLECTDQNASFSIGNGRIVYAQQPPGSLEPGTQCEVLIRPQHILIGEPALKVKNSYQGILKNRIYGGDYQKLEIEFSGHQSVFAQFPIRRGMAPELVKGANIVFGFAPEYAMVYPTNQFEKGI